jgi:hypothetical protein
MTEGGCLCGAVRFRVAEFNSGIFKCHCSKCRKSSGGASSAAALVGEKCFCWTQGVDHVREYRCDSGYTRRFCAGCGSIVPQFLAEHRCFWVPVGLLDADPGVPLKHHIHVNSKAVWEILDTQAHRHGEGFES